MLQEFAVCRCGRVVATIPLCPQVAIWAATNLAPLSSSGDGGLGWGFDLAGIAQMFRCLAAEDVPSGLFKDCGSGEK